jgi:nitrite reductase/ring-hydroxylating ferredoxin subunit/uncharacterized membrane protein
MGIRTESGGMAGSANAAAARLSAVIESAEWLDRPAESLQGVIRRVIGKGRLRDVLSGTPLGHPAHPMLVAPPIGLWSGALLLMLRKRERGAARTLLGAGVLAAVPAAWTGWSDWLDTDGAERRIGLVHASVNGLAIGSFALACLRAGRGRAPIAPLATGTSALALGGWLGGHLAYTLGVGVDTNAFESGPENWTLATALDEVGEDPVCVSIGGVRLVALSTEEGLAVLADRCSHRGGPLSEGKRVAAGCIECPWHGSRFNAKDGSVDRGPATAPQPTYATRVTADGIEVRRPEARALRRNTVHA